MRPAAEGQKDEGQKDGKGRKKQQDEPERMLVAGACGWTIRRRVLLIIRSSDELMTDLRHMKKRVLPEAWVCLLLASVALFFAGCQKKEEAPAQPPAGATTSSNAAKPAPAPEHPEHPK